MSSKELHLLNLISRNKEELGLISAFVSFEDKMIIADAKDYSFKIIIQEDKDVIDRKTDNDPKN